MDTGQGCLSPPIGLGADDSSSARRTSLRIWAAIRRLIVEAYSRVLDDGETRSRDMTGSFTYTDLVVPTPDQEVRYPLSGTITRQMTITVLNGADGERTRTVDVTITFDGSATAAATVNGETFEIDLTAREGHSPLRRGFGKKSGG